MVHHRTITHDDARCASPVGVHQTVELSTGTTRTPSWAYRHKGTHDPILAPMNRRYNTARGPVSWRREERLQSACPGILRSGYEATICQSRKNQHSVVSSARNHSENLEFLQLRQTFPLWSSTRTEEVEIADWPSEHPQSITVWLSSFSPQRHRPSTVELECSSTNLTSPAAG